MSPRTPHIASLLKRSWMPIAFLGFALFFAESATAQNTKGDKPVTNQRLPFFRLPKIKGKSKGGDRPNTRDISGRRRIRTKNASSANHGVSRASSPYLYEKRRTGDQVGKPAGRIFNKPPREGQRAWRGTRDGSPLRIRSASARMARHNVYPQSGPYVNNKSTIQKKPKVYTRTASRKPIYRSTPRREQAGRARGGYATASRPFVTRGRKNVYWGKFSKGERPVTNDLTGRPLRNRNFHSAGIGVGTTDTLRMIGRKPGGDRAGKARVGGGFISKSKRTEGAWLGDVSGRPIRRRPPRTGERKGIFFEAPVNLPSKEGERAGRLLHGGGFKTSRKKLGNQPLPARAPGIGADGIGNYKGRFLKGELSPGFSRAGADFRGNTRTRRPLKGGGSVSGKLWNNNRQPLQVRQGAPGSDRVARFQGSFKRGELSPGIGKQGYGYSGNIKARKPLKGGGSVSGKVWNNKEQPLQVRLAAPGFDKVTRFQGKFKAKKPKHGGGSISGKVFNNNGQPLPVRLPGSSEAKAANYSGKIQLARAKRNYIQNPKAADESLKKRKPKPNTYLANGLQVKRKQGNYKKKPAAADGALLGIGPKSGTVKASEYDHAIKMYWSYKRNPNSNEEALKTIKPTRGFDRVVGFSGRTRLAGNYRHNPSSSSEALKVLAPGRAYARINDYAGNTKMKKYNDRRLHPDAPYAHGSRDNVKEERTIMMNIKLFWAKLFKKNDTQPEITKVKELKPRYDRKEKDLWKALYD